MARICDVTLKIRVDAEDACRKLTEILALFDQFNWESDDRQMALEEIERIATS